MSRDVTFGQKGIQVTTLQRLLNSLMPPQPGQPALTLDGVFGEKTKARVERFQKRCNLYPDGVVGPLTNAKLLDIRLGQAKLTATPKPEGANVRAVRSIAGPSFRQALNDPSPAPAADPPSKLRVSVEAQFGRPFQLPPLDVSPWAVGGQFDVYVPNKAFSTEISVGGQFTKNLETSPNGKWTASSFLQLGVSGIKFGQFGPIDLFNPSVILFAQHNEGQQLTGGIAISNQTSIQVIGNDRSRLGVFWFMNVQTELFSVGLSDALLQIPSTQIFTGFRGEFIVL
jgi:peptidoglycan hydrolase-like protein with peptidoglycan-binding domain